MDEKPARILYSPARSIGLFKRYLVVSMFCIKSRDGRKACKDASFAGPIYRPVQTLSSFSRFRFQSAQVPQDPVPSRFQAAVGEIDKLAAATSPWVTGVPSIEVCRRPKSKFVDVPGSPKTIFHRSHGFGPQIIIRLVLKSPGILPHAAR